MRNTARTVKPSQDTVCRRCGQTLPARKIAKAKGRSPRRIILDGILAALDDGPANTREIERRMGFRPPTETANLLRILERKGEVRVSGSYRTQTLRKNPSFIWERASPTNRVAPAKQPQPIESAQPAHIKSPRGARP